MPRRLLAAILAGLCCLAVIAGCSDDDGGSASDDTTTTSAEVAEETTSTTTSTLIPVPDPRRIDDVVLGSVPAGFTPNPESFVSGAFDITAASELADDPMQERSTLETRGFVSAFSRGWSDPQDDTITVLAYDFSTADGASRYLSDGRSLLAGRGAVTFEVDGVPGGIGFTFDLAGTAEYAPFMTHTIAFARGNRWYAVITGGRTELKTTSPTIKDTSLVTSLAQAQLRLAEGLPAAAPDDRSVTDAPDAA